MIEFLTEAEKAKHMGRIAKFKAATRGSKGAVKKAMQRKGAFWKIFSGLIAELVASGELGEHNEVLSNKRIELEASAIKTLHSMTILKDSLEMERPQDEISAAAKRMKLDNMNMKKLASEMVRTIDTYKRVHDDDKQAGVLRFQVREFDRHDFKEIYDHLHDIEDGVFHIDKAASGALVGRPEYALRMIHTITSGSTFA